MSDWRSYVTIGTVGDIKQEATVINNFFGKSPKRKTHVAPTISANHFSVEERKKITGSTGVPCGLHKGLDGNYYDFGDDEQSVEEIIVDAKKGNHYGEYTLHLLEESGYSEEELSRYYKELENGIKSDGTYDVNKVLAGADNLISLCPKENKKESNEIPKNIKDGAFKRYESKNIFDGMREATRYREQLETLDSELSYIEKLEKELEEKLGRRLPLESEIVDTEIISLPSPSKQQNQLEEDWRKFVSTKTKV